jgi:Tol biopolymer transport system component
MPSGRLASLMIAAVAFVTTSRAGEPPWVGGEATRSRLTIIGVDGSGKRVVLDAPRRYAAPEWSPDGKSFIVNGGGKLWRVPASGGTPAAIGTGSAPWIDINHGISPDGKALAFTAAGSLFRMPASGGTPARVTPNVPSYLHAWSPDGKALAYAANRGNGIDLYTIPPEGGAERRLTSVAGPDDAPLYSPDGRWIYYLSERSSGRDIWRMPAEGAGPGDSKAERITGDDRDDAAPHPSPDGKWLIYLSYPPKTGGNAMDRDVLIRRIPLPGDRVASSKPEDVVRAVGGHGTLGTRPFAPDGRSFVYADYEPPTPSVRIVLFTPSDVSPPPGVPHRLTQIAEATERFFFEGMKRWGYPPAVDRIFRRKADGTVDYVHVKGDRPVVDAPYWKASCRGEAIAKAIRQLKIDGDGHIWWVFLYVGDRPKRFSGWEGGGCSRDGGSAIVNYDTIPGEIRPDMDPASGFNKEYFLKGTMHELGHAFGLPHMGPDPALGLGNTLMGANPDVYAGRKLPNADRTYLDAASAAMLWKHPVFSGTAKDRQRQPAVKIDDYKPSYDKTSDKIILAGKVISDIPAHNVVVLDDLGKPEHDYWYRSHVARVGPDGSFRLVIDKPARASGHLRMTFCFDNGTVTGDGIGVVYGHWGEVRTPYRYRDGGYAFAE